MCAATPAAVASSGASASDGPGIWPWLIKGLLFRLAAILLGLSPLVIAECVLVILGWGEPDYHYDPFMGFRSIRPLFVLDEAADEYRISPARLECFCPDSFAARKGADEFRIFCLGGSTVQGRPFATQTSFTKWLELSLRAARPERRWKVVNCGGVSYASYRLVPILEEILHYEPDLVIVYTGHNEFLEDRTYGHLKRRPAYVACVEEFVSSLRTTTLLRDAYRRLRKSNAPTTAPARPVLPEEVDALLDYRNGLEHYHRDDQWRHDVIEHFGNNLRRMVHIAREARLPLLLVNPVCNLRDCPPLKSEHRRGLSAEQIRQVESLRQRAREEYGRNLAEAVTALERAVQLDDEHAGLRFDLAKCYDARGRIAEAREAYVAARELDVCPLRILEPMQRLILRIGRETHTPVVDVQRLFEEHARDGIPGGFLLVDHVHPSIHSHQLIAEALMSKLTDLGVVAPLPGWQSRQKELYEAHTASLDDRYYTLGKERLRSLQNWAAGRATRAR